MQNAPDLTDPRLARIGDALHGGDRSEWEALDEKEREYLAGFFGRMREEGREIDSFSRLWEIDYKERPRTIAEFLTDPRFFGEVGKDVYPCWWDELEQVFAPESKVWQWIVSGSLGCGKTSTAVVALCYVVYKLSILRDPQRYHGLAPNSRIVIGLYNVYKYKVEGTSFSEMLGFMERSPYFREVFRYDERKAKNEIGFPNSVGVLSGSTSVHALGSNLYGSLIDEANFMRNESGGSSAHLVEARGQAHQLHASVVTRMKTRFIEVGKSSVPGLFLLVSSAKDQGDYTEREIGKVLADPELAEATRITSFSLWDAKPWKYDDRFFRVLVGDGMAPSRILEPEEDAAGGRVMRVPAQHLSDFRRDIEDSIRDLGGIPTFGSNLFLPWPDKITRIPEVLSNRAGHPFLIETLESDARQDNPLDALLDRRAMLEVVSGRTRPRVNPEAARYVHIDLSVNQDATGIGMGHCAGVREVRRERPDGSYYVDMAPMYYMDFVVQIRAAKGGQIDYSKIRAFLIALRGLGYPIGGVSFDSYNSVDSIQILSKAGFNAVRLSVDRVDGVAAAQGAPYDFLKQAIWEERFSCYEYAPLMNELRQLRRMAIGKDRFGRVTYKVDHPPFNPDGTPGGKDCADTVAGVCWHLSTQAPAQFVTPSVHAAAVGTVDLDELARANPESDASWLLRDHKDSARITGVR